MEEFKDFEEINDDELENVSGGTTLIDVNGILHPVVTSGNKCPVGKFEHIFFQGNSYYLEWIFSREGCCGRCMHVEKKHGIAYCAVRIYRHNQG